MKTWQVFDPDGKVVGSVTAETIADACKKAREGYCDFPTLVEIDKKTAISIQEVVDKKTELEIWLAGMIEEKLDEFTSRTGVPIIGINFNGIDINLILDINNVR